MIEKEEELHCSLNINFQSLWLLLIQLQKGMRDFMLLMHGKSWIKSATNEFQKMENQKLKYESVENVIMISLKRIEKLQQNLVSLKFEISQQLDQLIRNVDEQKNHIIQTGQQNVAYRFYDELDNLVKEKRQEISMKHRRLQESKYQQDKL
ncbi:unnamed protein product [Paramecium octaurelia]|uniref:Uncharacterized protein n=1 Tax=Paramecium octaurelia TaxID=43137 RepID=A0A8S1X0M9_PAROT|nr:unnamed protein product [Paramecium octaurelia]CAD8195696.1 unnamed protein product [Paramecium octaurelia]